MRRIYDIAVLGATPAGYAAAYYLAKQKRSVVLVDGPHPAGQCPLADWAPAGALDSPALPRSLPASCGSAGFRRVRYHNVSLDASVEYKSRTQAGIFVDYRALCKSLRSAASKAGVTMRSTSTPPAIRLQEDHVSLVGTTQAAARLLIVTHNIPNEILLELSLPVRLTPRGPLTAAGLDVPLGRSQTRSLNGVLHVVELPERSELGIFFIRPNVVHLRVITNSLAAGTRAAELSAMVSDLQQAQLLPGDLQLGRARGAIWHPPAGVALDLESHVAKRCLLAGAAGGFAEPITGQTIRPSIESALLAAEVALAALDSDHCQETLMSFKAAWRKRLGRYFRPPSTSLHLLLPLLFVNRSIVPRFSRALLYGESI